LQTRRYDKKDDTLPSSFNSDDIENTPNTHKMHSHPSIPLTSQCFSYFIKHPIIMVFFWVLIPIILFMIYTSSDPNIYKQSPYYPFRIYKTEDTLYKIGIITDLDELSQKEKNNEWQSKFKIGFLKRMDSGKYVVTWESETILESTLSQGGRGMELSELIFFNGNLYSCDDRTGIIYEIINDHVVPRYILADGDGMKKKPFKCEWMTVKNGKLYVGGFGKEWVRNNKIENRDPQWIKEIDKDGRITHIDWTENYEALRIATKTQYPGYLLHESCNWHFKEKKMVFFATASEY